MVQFLAGTWLIWLLVAVAFFIVAIVNQLKRMRRILKADPSDNFEDSFFEGITVLIVMWFLGGISFILFIIGIFAYFIK